MATRKKPAARWRIGRISVYQHHGGFWLYYLLDGRPVRRRVGPSSALAECEACFLNAQMVAAEAGISLRTVPAMGEMILNFTEVVPGNTAVTLSAIGIPELRSRFIAHHENVLASSLATISRYRSATLYLERFASRAKLEDPMRVPVPAFVEHLRAVEVSPNGHARSVKRRLRDKGISFILECSRSMYRFGQRQGLLSSGSPNPFAEIGLGRLKNRNAKPIFVFTAEQELAFFSAADPWGLAIHFMLAKTGARRGELAHLLIEDVDLDGGWWHVRSKPELGWSTKTSRDRRVPLVAELVTLLQKVIGNRSEGPVFLRAKSNLKALKVTGNRAALAKVAEQRLAQERQRLGRSLSRREEAKIQAFIWVDAGAIDADRIRSSFIRLAKAAGIAGATCVKSWRHTFATLLQQANVDVLVRQQTLGHQAGNPEASALGMTGVYTHTTAEFQHQEIDRALRLRPGSLELVQNYIANSKGSIHA